MVSCSKLLAATPAVAAYEVAFFLELYTFRRQSEARPAFAITGASSADFGHRPGADTPLRTLVATELEHSLCQHLTRGCLRDMGIARDHLCLELTRFHIRVDRMHRLWPQ